MSYARVYIYIYTHPYTYGLASQTAREWALEGLSESQSPIGRALAASLADDHNATRAKLDCFPCKNAVQ